MLLPLLFCRIISLFNTWIVNYFMHSFFTVSSTSTSVTASGAKRKAEEQSKGSAKKGKGAAPAKGSFGKKR